MGLSSKKSKTTNAPAAFAQPYLTTGLSQTQGAYNANQPAIQGLASIAQQGAQTLGQTAFQTSPFVQQAQNAAAQTFNGGYLNQNPGASTYANVAAARNPAMGTLAGLASGNDNPAYQALAGMAGQNNNPAFAQLQALASGSASPGDYSGIGAANPATGLYASLANGGRNSALGGLTGQAYATGAGGAGDATIAGIANGGGPGSSANGYDQAVLGGKYLNANPGYDQYMKTLNGDYLDGNPYIDAIAKQGEDAATKAANQRFAASGLGAGLSSAYTNVLSRNVADAGNAVRYENYNAERGRQLQAGSQADAAFANERGNMESASGRISSNYNLGQDRSLSAAQALSAGSRADTSQRLTALQALSGANQQQFENRATVAGSLGSLYDQQQGRQLQGQQARDQSFQADRSAQLAAAQGLGSLYNQGADRQLSAAQGLGSLYNSGQQNQISAAGTLGSQFNQGQQTQLQAAQAQDSAYGDERSRMLSALGITGQLTDAQYAQIAPLLQLIQSGAQTPFAGTAAYNAGVNGLTSGYGTQTGTQSPSLASQFGQAAQIGASIFSDRRLKTNIVPVGVEPDGLGVYDYDYVWGGERQRGVMADEVARIRPWALGPVVGGYATVNMGAL